MSAPWPHGDPDDVARAVLAQGKFRAVNQPPAAPSAWDLFWRSVADFFKHLFHPIKSLSGGAGIANFIGVLVLIAAAVGLLLVVVRFAPGLVRRRARPGANSANAAVHDQLGNAASLRARAMAAEAEGRHREAATLLWNSLLYAFDERGRARYDAARTPGEWRRILHDRTFDTVARDATVALFDDAPIDAALVARMNERYDDLVRA